MSWYFLEFLLLIELLHVEAKFFNEMDIYHLSTCWVEDFPVVRDVKKVVNE